MILKTTRNCVGVSQVGARYEPGDRILISLLLRWVAHKIYGIPQTINTANYVYFLALKTLSSLRPNGPDKDLDAIVTSNFYMFIPYITMKALIWAAVELLALHRGQGIELFWRDSLTCPTEEEYINMVNDSTYTFCSGWFAADPNACQRNRWIVQNRYQTHDSLCYQLTKYVGLSVKFSNGSLIDILPSDYVPLVNLLGIYFQIRDDYMNLQDNTVSLI